jgi:DNA-binding transcriptional ArsR family regulator
VARRSLSAKRKVRTDAVSRGHVLEGHGAASNLDRVIHEPVRLGILSALAANSSLSFRELKDLLRTTDGNLSVHARKLEEAAYVRCSKNFEGRLPRTNFRITATGRRALEDYIRHMEAIIQATRQ